MQRHVLRVQSSTAIDSIHHSLAQGDSELHCTAQLAKNVCRYHPLRQCWHVVCHCKCLAMACARSEHKTLAEMCSNHHLARACVNEVFIFVHGLCDSSEFVVHHGQVQKVGGEWMALSQSEMLEAYQRRRASRDGRISLLRS